MIFYIGLHLPYLAHNFEHSFISVNVLRGNSKRNPRKSDFAVNEWIMDSGAFSELAKHGKYVHSVEQWAGEINRWSKCGNFQLAVTQDYMCEPFMLEKTGLTIQQHQELTIERYDALLRLTNTPIMPVLQGYAPMDYVSHILMYGNRLTDGMRVGVGSVCKRNRNPRKIIDVLSAIKAIRPDLQLHGFGLKITALQNALICSMLYSADSMAWSYAARREGRNSNGIEEAMNFYNRINKQQGTKAQQLVLV